MAQYIDNYEGNKHVDWAMPFQRTSGYPLDRSSMFSTYEDALAYAQKGSDSRGLSGTSYQGQIISVVDADDNVNIYKIIEKDGERSLAPVGGTKVVLQDDQPEGMYEGDLWFDIVDSDGK